MAIAHVMLAIAHVMLTKFKVFSFLVKKVTHNELVKNLTRECESFTCAYYSLVVLLHALMIGYMTSWVDTH